MSCSSPNPQPTCPKVREMLPATLALGPPDLRAALLHHSKTTRGQDTNTGTTHALPARTEVAWCHAWHPPQPRSSQTKPNTHHCQEDHLAALEQSRRWPYLRSL